MWFFRLFTGRCPDPRQWDLFLSGRLTETADRKLRSHLECCSRCQRRLKETYPEHLQLQGLLALDSYAREPECAQLREMAMSVALPERDPTPPLDAYDPARYPLPPEYQLLAVLVQGPWSVLLKARNKRLQRVVTVELFQTSPERVDLLAEFQARVAKLTRLKHPNIVTISESGEIEGRPFLTTEFVDGGELRTWIHSNIPPPRRAAALVRDIALAIAYAHAMGVVHRELNPDVILMTRNGEPRVAGFGLATYLDSNSPRAGESSGSVQSLAPEVALGRVSTFGPAVDLYGIGLILYQLLTGRHPYANVTHTDYLKRVAQGEGPSLPSRERAGIPRDLERICLTCLDVDPARRYPTAAAVAEDLQHFLAGEPIRLAPQRPGSGLMRWLTRK